MAAQDNKIKEILQSTLENMRSMVDANTVIGNPINTPAGTVIIPISKISVGIASGGLDFQSKATGNLPQNFGGGGGTGLSVSPVGFLVVSADGKVDMINVGQDRPTGPIEQVADVIERSPEIIAKVKSIFVKNDDKANEKGAEVEKD